MAKKCKLTAKQKKELIAQQEKKYEQEEADARAIECLIYARRPGFDCRGGRRVIHKPILEDAWSI
jgi:uncharacterized protein (DUF169 family)